jgi:hypothetical protein
MTAVFIYFLSIFLSVVLSFRCSDPRSPELSEQQKITILFYFLSFLVVFILRGPGERVKQSVLREQMKERN